MCNQERSVLSICRRATRRAAPVLFFTVSLVATIVFPMAAGAKTLDVVTTVPDLASLAREIGGDAVQAEALTRGTQDPHLLDPRPSFIQRLSKADLFLEVGLELEVGWAPVLTKNARNPKVLSGQPGYLDASTAIVPIRSNASRIDRSMGDVHAGGNPHYLLDPVNGWRVAGAIREHLSQLAPERAVYFSERYADFEGRISALLFGDTLAKQHPAAQLMEELDAGTLDTFLKSNGASENTAGLLARMRPYARARTAADHDLWPYFARRFGIEIAASLEPFPGIAPTTSHLQQVITNMQAQKIGVILSVPYFDRRHAERVAEKTGAVIADMAHQVGSRPGTDDYLSMVRYNVETLAAALDKAAAFKKTAGLTKTATYFQTEAP